MLRRLRIQGFRGLKDLNFAKTARINLVVGRNDSGKTSVLEAIRLFLTGDPRTLRRTTRSLRERKDAPPEHPYLLAFYGGNQGGIIRIEGAISKVQLVTTAQIKPLLDEQILDLESAESPEHNGASPLLVRGVEVIVRARSDNGAEATISLPLDPSVGPRSGARRSFSGGTFPTLPTLIWLGTNRAEVWAHAQRYSNLVRAERSSDLIKILRSVEPNLKNLIVLADEEDSQGRAVLEVDIGLEKLMPLESMGDGFGSIIDIVSAVALAPNGICAIDEFENGVHYSILPSLWRTTLDTAREFESQVWATTHSMDCLLAAKEAFAEHPDQLAVHRLQKTQSGESSVHTFTHEMLDHALETGLEVR